MDFSSAASYLHHYLLPIMLLLPLILLTSCQYWHSWLNIMYEYQSPHFKPPRYCLNMMAQYSYRLKLDSLCLLDDSLPVSPSHPHPVFSPPRLVVCCFRPLLSNRREKGVLVLRASCWNLHLESSSLPNTVELVFTKWQICDSGASSWFSLAFILQSRNEK